MATRIDVMRKVRPLSSAVLAVYTLVLAVLIFTEGDPGGESGIEWLYLIPVMSATGMGLFLSMRKPDNAIGTLTSLTGAALVTNGLANMLIPRVAASGTDLETVLAVLAGDVAWTVQFLCPVVLLPLWFPTGSALNRAWAWVGRVAISCVAFSWLALLFADSVCAGYESAESSVCVAEVAIPWSLETPLPLSTVAFVAMVVAMLLAIPAIVSVFVRLRRSDAIEREQLKWVLLAVSLVAVGYLISLDNWGVPNWINDVVNALTLAGVWVAIAVAILRYRLYEIDRIISRTMSYAVVITLLAGVFAVLVAISTEILPSDEPLVVAVATLAVAALFNPLRSRVQLFVDKRFNRSRYDAERVADHFSGSLQDRVDADDIVSDWVGVVSETMQPTSVGVWVRS